MFHKAGTLQEYSYAAISLEGSYNVKFLECSFTVIFIRRQLHCNLFVGRMISMIRLKAVIPKIVVLQLCLEEF